MASQGWEARPSCFPRVLCAVVLCLSFTAFASQAVAAHQSQASRERQEYDRGLKTAGIEPHSAEPSETKPYAVCPAPTKGRATCFSAVVPEKLADRHRSRLGGPLLEGSGQLGGYSPADLRSAYALPSSGGAGQTVAITIAYDDPKAESDLAFFRNQYGLPPCTTANGCFRKVNQKGEEAKYPSPNSGWALETSLDLDMVSATCPECHILLVEASSNYLEDLGAAVDKAAEMSATVISNSWGAEEFSGETAEDHYFDHPGTPVLFASGDSGYGAEYPVASPGVVAVGGTSLKEAGNSRGWSETAWSGAGSGCSAYEKKPAWQKDGGCSRRTVADVSAVANPQTPVSVYDSFEWSGWELLGGTSVATPLVAGVEALSSSAFRAAGPSGFTRAGNAGALFDVTEGENGPCATESATGFEATYLCQADAGYDGPTGWGTPDGPQSLPVAVTESATVESTEKATLHGSVNPKGAATEYRFEYGETTSYGTSVPIPDESVGAGSEYVEVSQTIQGLKGRTPYHYRIVAVRSEETFPGVDRTFGTTPPRVSGGAANEIQGSSATLHAMVNPRGLDSTYYFEYGPTTSFGHKAPAKAGTLTAATTGTEVSVPIAGLDGTTTYYFRVVARNAAGISYDVPSSFTTEPSGWAVEYLPKPPNSGSGYRSYDVSCMQANRCVAVGEYWSLDVHTKVTLAELWNGTSWSVMTTPYPPGLDEGWEYNRNAFFLGVSCTPNDDCVAVGRYRDPSETEKPLAEHWDGSQWVITPLPEPEGATDARLESVSCASVMNCVAVGSFTNTENVQKTLAEHWDGTSWTIQPTPNAAGYPLNLLRGVSCSSSTSCTAVGAYGESLIRIGGSLAEHWDGTSWTIQLTPSGGTESFDSPQFYDVSCASASTCTAVGYYDAIGSSGYYTVRTLAERWNGAEWAVQSTPTPQEEGYFSGISCATSSACTAAGGYNVEEEGGWRTLIERWEGSTWSVPEFMPGGRLRETSFEAIACPQAKACMAVASTLSDPEGGLGVEYAISAHEAASLLGSFSFEPDVPRAGEPINFDGSGSSDLGHTIERYEWDFGDGSHGTGATPSHTYAKAGDYTVTLAITDDEGIAAEISHLVTVVGPKFPLTLTIEGSGFGTVTSSPAGIDCGVTCKAEFEEAKEVTLTATPAGGSKFTGWSGGGCSGTDACKVTMSEAKEVTASFDLKEGGPANPTLLKVLPTGQGTVTSNPAGIVCGAECEATFELNEMATLTANPASGYAFSSWGGCTEHVGLTCKVKMDKAKAVKAIFVATPSLTVEKAGSGYGKVSAIGISCDESCSKESAAVKTGTAVTVKAVPAKGSEAAVFEGGTGNASSCSASCSFTISENTSVKVKFSPIPTKALTVKLNGPGAYKGKVTGKGLTVKGLLSTAISCGSGCTEEAESFFATGETELIASASTGYKFAGWTVTGGSAGGCTGTTSSCKLATDADKTVEAEFK
jgi:hypothetical protein